MRTGKQVFNYRAYAVEWAVKILANVKGYTLEKAYSIDRVFGAMVEDQVNAYKREYERVQRFAVVCGAYNVLEKEMKSIAQDILNEIAYFSKNKYDWYTEYEHSTLIPMTIFDFGGNKYQSQETKEYERYVNEHKEALAYNSMFDKRMKSFVKRSVNIQFSTLDKLPKEFTPIANEGKALTIAVANNIVKRKDYTYDIFMQEWNMSSSSDEEQLNKDIKEEQEAFDKAMDSLVYQYSNNMTKLFKLKGRLLDED